jgi:serine/threonine protein kinase
VPQITFKSETARKNEWAVAVSLLKDAPEGTKIKRASNKKVIPYTHPNNGKKVFLQHSFIKIKGKILCMAGEGQHLGKGAFGVVKLAEDAHGNKYALKTTKDMSPQAVEADAEEASTLQDLGLSEGTSKSPRSKHGFKNVTALKYLGTSLFDYLWYNQPLTEEKQYDLAIKAAECVYRLHQGVDSQQGIKRAHLDIKPENFCIDDNGNISLIDYGLAEKLSGYQEYTWKGTPGYLPAFTYGKERKNEHYDVFALNNPQLEAEV